MASTSYNDGLKIPPRWLHCPRKGGLVAGKFLPFKTPLDSKYDDQIPEECRFDIDMFHMLLKSYKVKMGLVIDLTNTTRFYDKGAIEKNDCKYLKLQCRGHSETPSPDQTQTFIQLCDNFIRRNPLEIIGVHCTHGFNRTGFLISAYLVEKLDWSIEAAISAFTRERPPGIYKQDYLDELFKRYGDPEDTPDAPALPSWCTECDDTDRDDDGNVLSNGSSSGKRRGKEIKKNAKFMDGLVSGVTQVLTQPTLGQVQRRSQDMCGWDKSGFPGSQPVSMTMDNIGFMTNKPYKVSWKADGTRYMMLIDGPEQVYMLDRDNCVFHVPSLKFPKRKDLNSHVSRTLIDGEMIIDMVDDKPVPRYLIYDIIKFEDIEVGGTDLNTRLMCINKELISPRHELIKQGRLDKTREPFSIRAKPFWDITITKNLLDGKFSKEVAHEIDGLVFQPVPDKYTCGRTMEVLKWKPPTLNSVDFKLKIVRENKPGMLPETKGYLFVGGLEPAFGVIKVNKELKQLDNKIIECSWDPSCNQWKFMRQRTDKSFPNSYSTAMGVIESIKNPVTKERLFDVIDNHRWRPPANKRPSDRDAMPPPPQKIARH